MSEYRERVMARRLRSFFRVSDFETAPHERTLTIDCLAEGQVHFDKEMDVLYFSDDEHLLSMNATNEDTLMQLLGDEPAAWSGRKVTLYLTTYRHREEEKPCIRIKAAGAVDPKPKLITKPAPEEAPPPPSRGRDLDDDIPF